MIILKWNITWWLEFIERHGGVTGNSSGWCFTAWGSRADSELFTVCAYFHIISLWSSCHFLISPHVPKNTCEMSCIWLVTGPGCGPTLHAVAFKYQSYVEMQICSQGMMHKQIHVWFMNNIKTSKMLLISHWRISSHSSLCILEYTVGKGSDQLYSLACMDCWSYSLFSQIITNTIT